MICPNCRASLTRGERPDSVCAECGRPFALDPRVHGRGMHDTRIRRIAERATDGGRRQVTVTQLGYLARSANHIAPARPGSGRSKRFRRTSAIVLVAVVVVWGFLVQDVLFGLVGAGLALCVHRVARGAPYRSASGPTAWVVPSPPSFLSMIRTRWVGVYGGLPPGIVDDHRYRAVPEETDGPRYQVVELLCTDRAVSVFLAANGFPRRLNLTLVPEPRQLSKTRPVVVLHDAGARGLQLVADVRAGRPGVVVDGGLPVRAVVGNRGAVTLHRDPPADVRDGEWLRELARSAPKDAEWVAEGWYSPLAAVPPAVLEAAVERAVQQARDAADPDRREAAGVGFLTWPSAAGKDGS
ncbi:hypothetical protein SRB5_07780 [Streptomyces sp. RB5]|uniref:Uncharacterized protein n=1 Tax=Streptomyces smaragdinus TaxID=2585196 RepID=A0A7K0CB91_9ACTN|nr:hypothetical protein [Streptomyces smaragdinus]MQY10666.1 hypothetical protein [Streptomyces smaragdinus]